MAQIVKDLPAMQGTQVLFLGQEDPLEKGIATCSSILAWRIPWTEEPAGYRLHTKSEMAEELIQHHVPSTVSGPGETLVKKTRLLSPW